MGTSIPEITRSTPRIHSPTVRLFQLHIVIVTTPRLAIKLPENTTLESTLKGQPILCMNPPADITRIDDRIAAVRAGFSPNGIVAIAINSAML